MEYADFQKEYDADELECLLEEMMKNGRLSEKEIAALRKNELLGFFSSPLAKRIRGCDAVEKERPFAMLMAAKDLFLGAEYGDVEDMVLLNGIIDCYFMEGDNLILLDYKSDRIYDEGALRQRYEIQLKLYRRALEQALGKQVTEVYIYSFAMRRGILI